MMLELVRVEGVGLRVSGRESARRGLVLLHHRTGFDAFTLEMVERLNDSGFAVVAPDLFAGLPDGLEPEELKARLDDEAVLAAVSAGSAFLRESGTAAVSTIGFCMGGRLAFLAGAVGAVDSAVTFYGGDIDSGRHGGPSPLSRISSSSAPIQIHRGSRDSAATAAAQEAAVSAADACGTYLEACTYAGARHAFLNRADEIRYNERCAMRAWGNALRFLKEHTPAPSGAGR